MRSIIAAIAFGAALALLGGAAQGQTTNFEGHQIHPLEITPDGSKLLALNTPDARLAIFTIGTTGTLTLAAEGPVGIEPVSVRARTNTEAWVVNHVSDTLNIVDLTPGAERVKQTIKTDDEPADVVFAGTGDSRAFVSISQRNRVDVFDANSPGPAPLFQIDVDGEDPRALARNSTGTEVYAAVFHSGNQTLIISGAEGPATTNTTRVTDPTGPYGGSLPLPPSGYNASTSPFNTRPQTSLIVKWRECDAGNPGNEWCDDNGNSWDAQLTGAGGVIQMDDQDVAIIDADAATPGVTSYVTSVGTLNFGIVVNPASPERLYVSNTDARNHVRFERGLEIIGDAMGNEDGVCDDNEPSSICLPALNGHLVETRVTVVTGTTVDGDIGLNPHIDHDNVAISSIDKTLSLGQPNGMVFNGLGDRLYAASILSRKVAVIDTSSIPGTLIDRIDVGEGPTGVALAEAKSRLYVMNRHENTISVVNISTNTEILPRVSLFNPEPSVITEGRKFLYDAQLTSGRGDIACATCHAFGDFDLLAWDLGDPPSTECGSNADCVGPNNPFPCCLGPGTGVCPNFSPGCEPFHPLKGPRTTQTLRALGGTEPFHWHGDRQDFNAFNVAFPGLLRLDAQLPTGDMQDFTNFIMTVAFPPNPNRTFVDDINDGLSAAAVDGKDQFENQNRDSPFECIDCHALPTGTNGRFINAQADQSSQAMKVPQLRNMYEKTGLLLNPERAAPVPATTRSGFGFVDDGAMDTLVTFLSLPVFSFGGNMTAINNTIQFMMEFDTGQNQFVGHQITFDGTNLGDSIFNQLLSALDGGKIDLIVKGISGGLPRSWRCTAVSPSQASCKPDRVGESAIDATALRDQSGSGSELTFSAVPVGFGQRMGLDRDGDGFFDRDEIDAGSDPANAASTPASTLIPALGWRGGLVFAAILFLLLLVRRWRRSPA
jgi:DNA-binding beta-propeller fold protein YncE